MNYVNEWDAYAAEWMGRLIEAGELPAAVVDRRSIRDVRGRELRGYDQCHFFAGIGGWPLALRLAGWPSNRRIWTGSCPCQPWSGAGRLRGEADERHLWPEMFRILREYREETNDAPTVLGEQVAGGDGLRWLDGVFADLEDEGYTCGAADLPAASRGAPHIRQRLFWVAIPQRNEARRDFRGCGLGETCQQSNHGSGTDKPVRCCQVGGVADCDSERCRETGVGLGCTTPCWVCATCRLDHCVRIRSQAGRDDHAEHDGFFIGPAVDTGGMGFTIGEGPQGFGRDGDRGNKPRRVDQASDGSTATTGLWRDFYVVHCRDSKARRVGTGVSPLAHGLPRGVGSAGTRGDRMALVAAKANRVGRIHGYGNAIVPEVGALFIRAVMKWDTARKKVP